MKMKIKDIIVSDRIRKDLGDIQDLASDIETNGLINPIVVNKDNRLLAGERRLEAVKSLGWEEVPVTVMETVGPAQELSIEISENEARKEFSRAERADYMRRILENEKARAEERKKNTQFGYSDDAPVRPNSDGPGRADEITAQQFGIGKDTLRKEIAIAEHQDLLEPDDFADWDEGRLSTNKAYQRLKAKLEESQEETDQIKRVLHEERVGSIRARKQLEAEKEALEKRNASQAQDYNSRIAALEGQLSRERDKEPKTIERVIEKLPEDYEDLRQSEAMAKKENEVLRVEAKAKDEKIADLESRLEQIPREDPDKDALEFVANAKLLVEKYSGCNLAQLRDISDAARRSVEIAARELSSLTEALLQDETE